MSIKYIITSSQRLSNLLIQFISGSKDILDIYESLNESIKQLNSGLIKDVNPNRYQVLLENNLDDILVYTMEISRKRGNIKLLHSVLTLLITITHNSDDFSLTLLKTNLPTLVIEDAIKFSKMKDNPTKHQFIYSYSSIIFNIIRNVHCRVHFQHNIHIVAFKQVLQGLLSLNFHNIKMTAMMVLAFLTKDDDNDNNVILQHLDVIGKINKYVSLALKNKDYNWKGFNMWELLLGLHALSEIDIIKIRMINISHFVPTIIKVISSKSARSEHVTVALEIIKNLCIDQRIRGKLLKRFKIDVIIESLANSTMDSIKLNAEKLLCNLRQTSISPLLTSATPTSSYKFEWDINKDDNTLMKTSGFNFSRSLTKSESYDSLGLNKWNTNEFENNQSQLTSTLFKSKDSKSETSQWSHNRVSQWLTNNKLTKVHNNFSEFDGEMLLSIKNMKTKSPEIYYKELETSLKLSFLEILRFDSAIDKLTV